MTRMFDKCRHCRFLPKLENYLFSTIKSKSQTV